jgi:leader peptidase (prepilin peptidase)/N-methyltransferase
MPPTLQIFIAIFLGLFAGLIVNYLADVLPVRRTFSRPICLICAQELRWRDFLLVWRRCPHCGRRRPARTWLVLLISAAGFVWIALASPGRLGAAAGWFWLAYLLLVIVIDMEHRLILHIVTGLGAVVALITGSSLHGEVETVIGGAIGTGVMLVFYWLGIVYARWSSRWRGVLVEEGDALGFGDVTFGGVTGLLLGWPGVIAGLMFAVLFAGAASLLALIPMAIQRKYNPNLAFPYGPFMAIAVFYLLYLR